MNARRMLVLATLVGCVDPAEVVVHFTADDGVAADAEQLRVDVFPLGEARRTFDGVISRTGSSTLFDDDPTITVVPIGGDAARRFRLVATVVDDEGDEIGHREVIAGFLPEQRRDVHVRFSDACASLVECPTASTCREDGVAVECVPSCVTPSEPGVTAENPSVPCGDDCSLLGDEALCEVGGDMGRCVGGQCCTGCFERIGDDEVRCRLPTSMGPDGQSTAACGNEGRECSPCDCHEDECDDSGTCKPVVVAERLAMSPGNVCAATGDGLYCWGRNDHEQAQAGTTESTTMAVRREESGSSVGLGTTYGCSLTTRGLVQCWGEARYARVPDAALEHSFSEISVGFEHVCGLEGDRVFCWGDSERTGGFDLDRADVDGGWLSIDSNRFTTCGIRDDGSLHCWGFNNEFQAGQRERELPIGTSYAVPFERPVRSVNVGYLGTSLIDDRGQAYVFGELRDNLRVSGDSPFRVPELLPGRFKQIASGRDHVCGILTSGSLVCIGRNAAGQLGVLGTGRREPGPLGWRYVHVVAGDKMSCAVREDGTVWCWGINDCSPNQSSDIAFNLECPAENEPVFHRLANPAAVFDPSSPSLERVCFPPP